MSSIDDAPVVLDDHHLPRSLGLWTALGLWLLCVAIAGAYAWWIRPNAPDDAMIYLRYVANVLNGEGWVYNAGDWVNGSTSTGNTLALIVLGFLCGQNWLLAQTLAFALGLGTALFAVLRLFAPEGLVPMLLSGLLLFATPMLGYCLGMDTPLILGFAGLSVWLYRDRHYTWCGLALGLLCLVRPDGIFLVAAVLGAFALRHRGALAEQRRPLLVAAALFCAVQLPWYGYSLVSFGELLPRTLDAKLAQVEAGVFGEPPVFVRGFHDTMGVLQAPLRVRDLLPDVTSLFGKPPGLWPSEALYYGVAWFQLGALVFTYVAGLAGLVVAALRQHIVLPILAFGVLHFLAYAALGLGVYAWYYLPLSVAITLGVATLVATLWRSGETRGLRRSLQLCGLVIALVFAFVHLPAMSRSNERYAFYGHYVAAAEWIRSNAPQDASVACCEIGVLGFELLEHPIVDMWGLINRDGAAAIVRGELDWWVAAEPDYVLVHHTPWPNVEAAGLRHADFANDYELVQRIRHPVLPDLAIFRRRF